MVNSVTPYQLVFYVDSDSGRSPGKEYLNTLPIPSRVKALRLLFMIADFPPTKFPGGGFWEAMHGSMAGWFELRLSAGRSLHHRIFCLLDKNHGSSNTNLLVVITGLTKKSGEVFTKKQYAEVDHLGHQYLDSTPRVFAAVARLPLDSRE